MIDFSIYIVEHEETMRMMMTNSLKEFFHVSSVATGNELFSLLTKEQPQLILIDFQVEDMSSIELQQRINKEYPQVHSVMISNIDRSRISLESMRRRAIDYIYRTDDPERFRSDVCKLVRYLIDIRIKMPQESGFRLSGYYALAQKLYEEKKWTVEDIERLLMQQKK